MARKKNITYNFMAKLNHMIQLSETKSTGICEGIFANTKFP